MRFGCNLNKLFDYFASGKPVLSDLNTNFDLIERFQAGTAIKIQDAEAFADRIIKYKNLKPDAYKKYCENSRRAAEFYDYYSLTKKIDE